MQLTHFVNFYNKFKYKSSDNFSGLNYFLNNSDFKRIRLDWKLPLSNFFTQNKMKIRSLNTTRTLAIFFSVAMAGCTGLPEGTNANPEFRRQMEGKTIGEATGNSALWGQTEESIAKKVFPGKTSKSDIRVIFGSADNVSLSDTGEIWTYESSVVTIFSGASFTRNKLLILFDEKGVVKRYSMNVDAR